MGDYPNQFWKTLENARDHAVREAYNEGVEAAALDADDFRREMDESGGPISYHATATGTLRLAADRIRALKREADLQEDDGGSDDGS